MITKLAMRDADLVKTKALPAAAGATIVTDAIDIGPKSIFRSVRNPNAFEITLEVPALTTTIIPDTRTATYSIEASDDPAFGSGVDTLQTVTVTGAGGAGVAAQELRVVPRRLEKQYVRGKVVFGASTTTGAAVNCTFALNF